MSRALRASNDYRLRWDCHKGGKGENCFNRKCRLKFHVFADCFPPDRRGRRVRNFSDVDGICEIAGAFALLEWKRPRGEWVRAQTLLFERITIDGRSVAFAIEGDAERMTVERFRVFWCGKGGRWRKGGLDALKDKVRGWAYRADASGWQSASWRDALRGDRR